MNSLTRFGLSIDDKLLETFDQLIAQRSVKHGHLVCTTTGAALT